MQSIKLPKLLLGLSLVLLAGVFSGPPVFAQAPPDNPGAYDSQRPDDPAGDDDPAVEDDDPADRPEAGDDASASDDDRDNFALSEEESRCAAEFRSFDPASGTYLNDSGERERCPYLY